jgi:hypothetical protein
MFDKAKVLDTKPAAKDKVKKKELPIEGMMRLASLEAIQSMVKAAIEVTKNGFSETVMDKFVTLCGSSGEKPESFNAIDGAAVVNVQIRKRGSNSALNEEEIAILKDKGFEPKKAVVTPELWGIDPKYASDNKLMEKVEKALLKAGLPDDLFVHQPEVCKYVVSDELEMQAWKSPDSEVLGIVQTLAYRSTLNVEAGKLPETLLSTLKDLLGVEDPVTKAVDQVKKAEEKSPARKTVKKAA